MKSVFKTVAPIAMTITFALTGVAMADTAAPASTSADTAKIQSEKLVANHKHTAKTEAAAVGKTTPAAVEATVSAAAPVANDKTVLAATESSKKVEPAKAK